MKKNLFLLSFLFFASCFQQPFRDCKTVKTGKFSFTFTIDKIEETSTFERLDDLQIETFRGKTDTSTVRWINDCEFVLEKLHPKSMADRKKVHIKITETTDEGYQFDYGYVGDGNQTKGFAKRVN